MKLQYRYSDAPDYSKLNRCIIADIVIIITLSSAMACSLLLWFVTGRPLALVLGRPLQYYPKDWGTNVSTDLAAAS
jgi:hypothetical protein